MCNAIYIIIIVLEQQTLSSGPFSPSNLPQPEDPPASSLNPPSISPHQRPSSSKFNTYISIKLMIKFHSRV